MGRDLKDPFSGLVKGDDPPIRINGQKPNGHILYHVVRKGLNPGERSLCRSIGLGQKKGYDTGEPYQEQNERHNDGMTCICFSGGFDGFHVQTDKDDMSLGRFIIFRIHMGSPEDIAHHHSMMPRERPMGG